MAGDKYRIADTESTYFLTLTVVYWIDLFTRTYEQKLDYLHENPVRAGWVENPEDFLYSSARDYSGKTGLIHGITVLC